MESELPEKVLFNLLQLYFYFGKKSHTILSDGYQKY